MPRIEPLEPPYEPEIEDQLKRWMPPGSDAEPLRLFRTLQRHPELASRMRPLGAGILGRSALVQPREREVMVHRTCALTGASYEWGVHAVAFGAPLGLSDEQLRSTVVGDASDPCWSQRDALIFELADELHHHATISDQLFESLREQFSEQELLELVITAGWYHVIAYVLNVAAVEPEPWAAPLPS